MKAFEIARFLNSELIGEDIDINKVCSLNHSKTNSLAFYKFNRSFTSNVKMLVLVNHAVECNCCSYIRIDNPRLAHAKVVAEYFIEPERLIPVGDGSTIVNGKLSEHHAGGLIIYDCVEWGKDCYFKPGAVIGSSGFGFEHGEDGIPILRPHIGGVKIGNNVQVGANSIIQRGTIDDTIIGNNVKIDDLVHIGHNSVIGDNTIITSGAAISGTVTIGKNCWIGVNSTLIQHITIGDNVVIGIGANVAKDVPAGSTYAGFMAQPIEKLRHFLKAIRQS